MLLALPIAAGLARHHTSLAQDWKPGRRVDCLLEQSGTIAKPMRTWVDQIVEVGNKANHELDAVDRVAAERIAKFTHQVLVLHYEMKHLMVSAFAEAEPTQGRDHDDSPLCPMYGGR